MLPILVRIALSNGMAFVYENHATVGQVNITWLEKGRYSLWTHGDEINPTWSLCVD